MNNPLPPATHSFHPTETVPVSDIVALSVLTLLEYRALSGHKPAAAAYTLPIVARAGRFEITQHNYGEGPVLECSCPAFDAGKPCAHIAAYRATQPETNTELRQMVEA